MSPKMMPETLLQSIDKAQTFLLVGHQKPDGDAVGSITALAQGLRAYGKTAHAYFQLPLEDKLLCFEKEAMEAQTLLSAYDVLFYLDCSTPDYAFVPEKEILFDRILVVDHHISNQGFGDVNWVQPVSSTGELVFQILEALKIPLTKSMADSIYTAISTDTGQFTFSNLSPETFRIIGALYRIKHSYTPLAKALHSIKSEDQMRLYGAACQSLTLYSSGRVAVVILDKATLERYGGLKNVTDDIANIGVNVRGVALGMTFKETVNGCYRVSLRSCDPWPMDVSILAQKYGGGGHYRAAGLSYTGKPKDLVSEVIDLFSDALKEPCHG